MGVAYSKTAAKTASEEKKPDGYFEIPTREDFIELLSDRDVRALYTVGAKTAEKLHASGIRTVREIRENADAVMQMFGKQGVWIVQLANGIDDRRVVPYRPEDAKSISRELTFQEDVENFALLQDVLLLLALCVEHRAKRYGLHGRGVTLKLTYGDMKSISRSKLIGDCDDAMTIYETASDLLREAQRRPVRLIGAGIYNLSGEEGRQLTLDDLSDDARQLRERKLRAALDALQRRYGLDFAGHLEDIYHSGTLHRTAEYMRKHI